MSSRNYAEIRRMKLQRARKRRLKKLRIQVACGLLLIVCLIAGVKKLTGGVQAEVVSGQGTASTSGAQRTNTNGKVVVVDPGHGGNDPGCIVDEAKELYEKDINIKIALKLKEELESRGYEVIMTRTKDTSITVSSRAALSNKSEADIFVSIHQNILEGDTVTNGIETWYHMGMNTASESLAEYIQKEIVKESGAYGHGIKEDDELIVLIENKLPACLIETGFVSNPSEKTNLLSDKYQQTLAAGIANGIDAYFGL